MRHNFNPRNECSLDTFRRIHITVHNTINAIAYTNLFFKWFYMNIRSITLNRLKKNIIHQLNNGSFRRHTKDVFLLDFFKRNLFGYLLFLFKLFHHPLSTLKRIIPIDTINNNSSGSNSVLRTTTKKHIQLIKWLKIKRIGSQNNNVTINHDGHNFIITQKFKRNSR